MKATLLIALLAAGTVVLPAAAAHILFNVPVENADGSVTCVTVSVGLPNLPPHGIGSILPCLPPSHGGEETLP